MKSFIIIGVFVVDFLYKYYRHGSYMGVRFNANIKRTIGEIAGKKSLIKVYVLAEKDSNNKIGLYATSRSGIYPITVVLSLSEVKELIKLLEEANNQ